MTDDLSTPLAHTTVTNSWNTESTSALLRQTQAALAASQQDLTTARAAIDDVEKYRKLTAEQRDRAEAERDLAQAELASARQELGHQRVLIDQVIADRAALRTRLADFEALARAAIHYVTCSDSDAETGEPYDALVHVVRVHERNGGTDGQR